jgi:hypothetical protein
MSPINRELYLKRREEEAMQIRMRAINNYLKSHITPNTAEILAMIRKVRINAYNT